MITNRPQERANRVYDLGSHKFDWLDTAGRKGGNCQVCYCGKGVQHVAAMYCRFCNKKMCGPMWNVWHSSHKIRLLSREEKKAAASNKRSTKRKKGRTSSNSQ